MDLFQRGLRGLVLDIGLNAKTVVTKETGELLKTLVRISPPKEPTKTRANIKDKVMARFDALSSQNIAFAESKQSVSASGVKWYAASSKYLFGATADSDMRKSSAADLLQVYYRAKKIQGSARIVLPFTSRRTRQRVALVSKIIAGKQQVNALVRKIQSHVGRLKASWLAPVVR